MLKEIILSLITGIVSAVIYSIIQNFYLNYYWFKTKSKFLTEIKHSVLKIRSLAVTILEIDVIYDNGEENDHLMTDEELLEEVKLYNISDIQFSKLSKGIRKITEEIEKRRRDTLNISTFTPMEFHTVDKLIFSMSSFYGLHSWVEDEILEINTQEKLKEKLIEILILAETVKFPVNFFDKLIKYINLQKFLSKSRSIHLNKYDSILF